MNNHKTVPWLFYGLWDIWLASPSSFLIQAAWAVGCSWDGSLDRTSRWHYVSTTFWVEEVTWTFLWGNSKVRIHRQYQIFGSELTICRFLQHQISWASMIALEFFMGFLSTLNKSFLSIETRYPCTCITLVSASNSPGEIFAEALLNNLLVFDI